jgi:hypothetical protein
MLDFPTMVGKQPPFLRNVLQKQLRVIEALKQLAQLKQEASPQAIAASEGFLALSLRGGCHAAHLCTCALHASDAASSGSS